MISDFIYLAPTKTDVYDSEYVCALPDIGNEDDVMIQCGRISIHEDSHGECRVRVMLSDHLRALCLGDTYQQKHFVQTILDIIEMQSDYVLNGAIITVNDFLGECTGTIDTLDESFH